MFLVADALDCAGSQLRGLTPEVTSAESSQVERTTTPNAGNNKCTCSVESLDILQISEVRLDLRLLDPARQLRMCLRSGGVRGGVSPPDGVQATASRAAGARGGPSPSYTIVRVVAIERPP